MFCSQCGQKLIDGASFCTNCGTKIIYQEQNLTKEMTQEPVENTFEYEAAEEPVENALGFDAQESSESAFGYDAQESPADSFGGNDSGYRPDRQAAEEYEDYVFAGAASREAYEAQQAREQAGVQSNYGQNVGYGYSQEQRQGQNAGYGYGQNAGYGQGQNAGYGQGQNAGYGYGQEQYQGYQSNYLPRKSKIAAGVLSIILGDIGVGYFYMGRIGLGLLSVFFCWTGIPAIVGLIQGIIWLCMSDEDFCRKYNCRIS